MDQGGLPVPALIDALNGLGRVHRTSLTAPFLGSRILEWARKAGRSSISLLDIACGGGHVLSHLQQYLSQRGIKVKATGIDTNPSCIAYAQRRSSPNLSFLVGDALALSDNPYDVTISTFFLHHLSDSDAVLLVRRIRDNTTGLMLIYDLLRSRTGYVLAWIGSKLLSRSPVVHKDALLSVQGAFTRQELRSILDRAGLQEARVEGAPASRAILIWER